MYSKHLEMTDWQPRACISRMYRDDQISLDDWDLIEETAKNLNIENCHEISCIEYQRNLAVAQIRRAQGKGQRKMDKQSMKYEDFHWLQIVVDGTVNKRIKCRAR